MIQIILNPEQEKLLQEQLDTGKYNNPDEVITDALKGLAEKRQLNQSQPIVNILSGEAAQNLLEEKIKIMPEIKNNYQVDPHKQTLAREFIQLCEEAQDLHADQPLNEAEIAEEVDADRKSEATIEATKKELMIDDLGWLEGETKETYYRLLNFKEDWEAPGMEAYDEL